MGGGDSKNTRYDPPSPRPNHILVSMQSIGPGLGPYAPSANAASVFAIPLSGLTIQEEEDERLRKYNFVLPLFLVPVIYSDYSFHSYAYRSLQSSRSEGC
jgi:hypothetical protein